MASRLGSVEAGGTETVCVIGSGPDAIDDRLDLLTSIGPGALLERIGAFFDGRVDAIGLGWFGPIGIDPAGEGYGVVGMTPKEGWSDVDVVGSLRGVGVPVGLDTDVAVAALAEGRWGAARGLSSYVYLTVGTGIGGAAVVDGAVVHGLGHSEMGHIAVPRAAGDDAVSVCPFHDDCLEGLASGPAVAARWGEPGERLPPHQAAEAADLVAGYVAQGIRAVTYMIAPERIVVGGGVTRLSGFHGLLRTRAARVISGYPGQPGHDDESYIVAPALGDLAGALGGLVLAERVLGQ